MPIGNIRAHLGEALQWSPAGQAGGGHALVAAAAMAAPTALGFAIGQPQAGIAAALGAMMATGATLGGGTVAGYLREQAWILLATVVAVLALSLLAGAGSLALSGTPTLIEAAALAGMMGLAALLGGVGYGAALLSVRFMLFLLLLRGSVAGTVGADGALLFAAVVGGVLWCTLLGCLMMLCGKYRSPVNEALERARPALSWRRWWGGLRHYAGWHYPLRLLLGAALALLFEVLCPQWDLHWAALTVVLLSERRPTAALSVKATQRALGTVAGVLLASSLLLTPAAWLLVLCIAVLAALRVLLRHRNYLAYSVIMTPLLVLMMDAAQPPDPDILPERLVATLAGVALVMLCNALLPSPRPASAR